MRVRCLATLGGTASDRPHKAGRQPGIKVRFAGFFSKGVTGAVEFFMVIGGPEADGLKSVNVFKKFPCQAHMPLYDCKFLVGKFVGLFKDRRGDLQLAYVVEGCSQILLRP